MNSMSIKLEDDGACFLPGETVNGVCTWDLDRDPKNVEIVLFWRTSGTGRREVILVESVNLEAPGRTGTKELCFSLPWGPYSFQSSYIRLDWTIELIAYPLKRCARIDIMVSPTRHMLVLTE